MTTTYTDPIASLVHSTVRIVSTDTHGNTSTGTGYIFNFLEHDNRIAPCIVTNKHVLTDSYKAGFHFTVRNDDGSPNIGKHELIEISDVQRIAINHPSSAIDLVALPIGHILNGAEAKSLKYYYVPLGIATIANEKLLSSLGPMEPIVMIGYPNGLWDEKHNMPIIRKGITATHPKLFLNGKPEFLIDAACFPGSSGSPVFLANIGSYTDENGSFCLGSRMSLLGTLYAGPQHTTTGEIIVVTVPTDTKSISVGSIPNNLGYVINGSALIELEAEIKKALQPKPRVGRNDPCHCKSGRKFKECCGSLK